MTSISIQTSEHAEQPKGAPFQIEQMPFGGELTLDQIGFEEDKVFNWPIVYILANSTSAYVGQTTSIVTRMKQHGANEEKQDFTKVNIIYNPEFNASVITDYEHRLIGYMHADGRYRLTNKNDGMTDTNYFSKPIYTSMFNELWEDLRTLDLADHSIEQIEESEVFKYSPFKKLTADQYIALEQILKAVKDGFENASPMLVKGMPGTGKTILAIYLLKCLKDTEEYKNLNIKLLEPVTSLRNTLKKALGNVEGLSEADIISPTDLAKTSMGYVSGKEKCFDIVLIDEAHKLKRRVNLATQYGNYDRVNRVLGLPKEATQLDWLLNQVKLPIFFYDPMQAIGPSCVRRETFADKLESVAMPPIELKSQMRVKAGKEYLTYIQQVLDGTCDSTDIFEGYDLALHDNLAEFVDSFKHDREQHDLSRMVAGYAWKWISKGDSSVYDIELDGAKLRWNCTYDDWVGKGVDNPEIANEVGCIHSIQGYDLSYAYVIIGPDLVLDDCGKPYANRKSYFDRNGYATASDEELDRFIKNIYYVLLTRGILGTHVYVADSKLREYFAKYLPHRVP